MSYYERTATMKTHGHNGICERKRVFIKFTHNGLGYGKKSMRDAWCIKTTITSIFREIKMRYLFNYRIRWSYEQRFFPGKSISEKTNCLWAALFRSHRYYTYDRRKNTPQRIRVFASIRFNRKNCKSFTLFLQTIEWKFLNKTNTKGLLELKKWKQGKILIGFLTLIRSKLKRGK